MVLSHSKTLSWTYGGYSRISKTSCLPKSLDNHLKAYDLGLHCLYIHFLAGN